VTFLHQFSTQDNYLCNYRMHKSGVGGSSRSERSNISSECIQQIIFNSDMIDLSIPSWGDGGKSNNIILFPKLLTAAEAASALAAHERNELHEKEALEVPAQCRPLKWESVPPLVDHRTMIAAVAVQKESAKCKAN